MLRESFVNRDSFVKASMNPCEKQTSLQSLWEGCDNAMVTLQNLENPNLLK